jgi:hypothetical protein
MVQRQIAFEKTQRLRKALTLSDISPIWNERLKGQLPFPLSYTWWRWYFELKYASKCVVGEAHNFSSSYIYKCTECDDIGWRFMLYFTLHSYSKLEENKQRFLEHWNEKHAESIQEDGRDYFKRT